jgi:hypothetical protein
MIANERGGSHNAIDKGGRYWRDSFLQVQEDQLRMTNRCGMCPPSGCCSLSGEAFLRLENRRWQDCSYGLSLNSPFRNQ